MIQTYFAHIKATIDKYAAANFVLDAHVSVFRYDNAQHKPALLFTGHKHLGDTEVIQADAPALTNVLAEIAQRQEWI